MRSAGAERETAGGVSVHLVGTFDVANFGDLILPAVTERELHRRIPDLTVRRLAPYGWDHPVPMDAGELAEPLGEPTPARRAEVARCDALVIGGGEILHFHDHFLAPHYDVTVDDVAARAPSSWFVEGTGPDAAVPTAWNAVGIPFDFDDDQAERVRRAAARHRLLVVRDGISRKRLEQVGIDQEVVVVPDPGFLVPRLFDPEVVARRRRLHATLGWAPPGRYVVVQGNGSMLNEVDRVGMAIDAALADRPDVAVVVLETGIGHGDRAFADAFVARYPGRTWRPDAPLLPVDLVALLAGAETSIGVSLHAAITVMAHGRRAVVFNAPDQTKLRGLVDHLADRRGYVEVADELPDAIGWALADPTPDAALGAIERSLDAHFDRLAEFVEQARHEAARTGVSDGRDRYGTGRDGTGRDGTGRDHGAGRDDGAGGEGIATRTDRRRVVDELRALRIAHAVRGRQLVAERDALTSLIDDRDQMLDVRRGEVEAHQQRIADLESRLAELEAAVEAERARTATVQAALDAVHATRTMRWLRWPRRVYAWVRR